MTSCSNVLAASGAFITSAGFGIISYNLYEASKDALVSKTAAVCETLLTSVQSADYLTSSLRILLPKAMPLGETAVKTICEATIRLDAYGQAAAVGTGLISIGSLVYGLSRFIPTKTKKE